jgi:hypothetical protein
MPPGAKVNSIDKALEPKSQSGWDMHPNLGIC